MTNFIFYDNPTLTLVCMPSGAHAIYSLETAARLAGVHPEMLRYYCRLGLFGEARARPETELIFDDELRPNPDRGIRAEIARGATERDARLHEHREPNAAIYTGQAQLSVKGEEAELLRVQLRGAVQAAIGANAVRFVAGHQVDRDADADDGCVGDAVVEAEGALKGVLN